jgi:hypothetical protein
MSLKKRVSRFGGLTSDIIKSAESASNERGPTLTTTPDEITRLWNHQYGQALRACLSRAEVREVVSVAKRKAWPHLNDGAARLGSMREFAERASALGADLRIAKMPWPSGLAVLGFYLGGDSGLDSRPLICLNGAHHPAAIATAFLHEVGHHVTAKLFSNRDESVQLSRQTGRTIVRHGVPSKDHRERGAAYRIVARGESRRRHRAPLRPQPGKSVDPEDASVPSRPRPFHAPASSAARRIRLVVPAICALRSGRAPRAACL